MSKAGVEYFYHAANLQRSFLSLTKCVQTELKNRIENNKSCEKIEEEVTFTKVISNAFANLFSQVEEQKKPET